MRTCFLQFLIHHCTNNQLRFPFDWQNPFGFFVAIAIEYGICLYMAVIGAGVLVLAIGCYLYAVRMAECIKVLLFDITQSAGADETNLMKQLVDFIEFHSRAKQLSSSSGKWHATS